MEVINRRVLFVMKMWRAADTGDAIGSRMPETPAKVTIAKDQGYSAR